MTVTLKPKTEITVPKSIRRKAGIKPGDQVEFSVTGRVINIVPKTPIANGYPLETVTRIIKEAKKRPLSSSQGEALDAELMAYGAQRAKKVGVKERDIPRIIHESRARRRTP